MGKALRVLIVEDLEDDALAMVRELERGGYEVDWQRVETAEDMQAALRDRAWDVVLADYKLPHFSAPKALEVLQGTEQDLPCIIISGSIGEDVAVQAMKAGAHDFLLKDNMTRLAPAIEREMREADVKRQRRAAEEERDTHRRGLAERVKELRCLYDISRLIVQPDTPVDEMLRAAVELIPQGWLYPEITRARIVFEGREFACEGFRETPWKQSADIVLSGETVGTVEVCYLEERAERDEGAFLGEERALIAEIARQLSLMAQRERAINELEESEARYRMLFEGAAEGILVADIATRRFNYANPAMCRMLGYTQDELTRLGVPDIHPKEDLPRVISEFEAQARGERSLALDIPCLRKDGSVWYADIATATAVIDERQCNVGFFTDITERRRSEAELKSLKQQMEFILGATRTGIDIIDSEFNIRYIDPEWQKVYGEPTGRKCYEYFMDRDDRCPDCGIVKALETKKIVVTEEVLPKENDRPIQVTTMPFQNERGEWLVAEVNADISERKRAEKDLQEAEERLRLALSAADMGTWRWVPATNRDTRDGSFNRILGLEPVTSTQPVEDFLGRVHPDDRAAVAEALESARRERKTYVAEFRITRPDAQVRWLHDRGMGFYDQEGQMTYMTGAVVDITELRQTTDALRETNEYLESLFDYANAPVIVWDPQFKIAHFNRAFESLTGRKAADVIGESVDILFPPATAASSVDLIKKAMEGERWETVEIKVLHVDGSVRTVLWNSATLMAADGKTPTASIAQGQDITERKQLEAQFLQAQKLDAVGRLAGGVAHDFNNLLTGIKGCVGFALEGAEAASQAHEDLTEALALTDRAADLTRQLLAFSRRQTLEPVVLNLNSLIADHTKMLTRLLREDIDVRFAPTSGLGNVRVDPGHIEQVIMNLAINARDAMPDGGKLTIETANVELDEDYARGHVGVTPGPYVMMAISDNGCGMDAETEARIFEPFFTTKETGKGTGLGLSTVYGIVKQHGGNIWVYSEPGKGTTFKVYLPRVVAEPEELAPKSKSTVGGTETILLAEDDDAVRNVGRRHLEALGYRVLCASSAREAEEAAQGHQGRIDLLLTDVVMPDRNGRELYESLEANQAGLKVLYMSGYTGNAIVHRGVLEEGTAFLQKPFEREDLAAKVRQALKG